MMIVRRRSYNDSKVIKNIKFMSFGYNCKKMNIRLTKKKKKRRILVSLISNSNQYLFKYTKKEKMKRVSKIIASITR